MNLKQLINEIKKTKDKNPRWRYLIEINKNLSIPLASVLFVIVGAGIGMRTRTGGLSVGVCISFFIFIIYYILLIGGEELAERGILHPMIGIWLPNFFLIIIGSIILKKEIYGE